MQGKLTMRAHGEGIVVEPGAFRGAFIADDGTRNPWHDEGSARFAVVNLANLGHLLVEKDGATLLWNRGAKGGPLAMLWPALPPRPQVGATHAWTIAGSSAHAVYRTEMARGALRGHPQKERFFELLPDIKGEAMTWQIRLASVTPESTAVFEGKWTDERHTNTVLKWPLGPSSTLPPNLQSKLKVQGTGSQTIKGHWEITAAGRLLFARLETSGKTDMAFGDSKPQHHRHTSRQELFLVEACDGPTRAIPKAADDLRSAALERWVELTGAVGAGKSVPDIFAPAVMRAHGRDKIAALLARYLAKYGSEALGARGTTEVVVAGNIARFRFGATAVRDGQNHSAMVAVEAELQPTPRFIAVKVAWSEGAPPILEISAKRLHTE